jgi:ATP-binding protein involved in chromosome partitioning
MPEKRKIRDVKKVVAVSSAKGGVGKSTIAGMLPFSIPMYFSNWVAITEDL